MTATSAAGVATLESDSQLSFTRADTKITFLLVEFILDNHLKDALRTYIFSEHQDTFVDRNYLIL